MTESNILSRLRRTSGAAGMILCAFVIAQSASAHQLGPNYETLVTSVAPKVSGLTAQVVPGEGQLRLTNRSRMRVIVSGYDDEPYLRFDVGGRVYVNERSPAHYLNQDVYARSKVPKIADPAALPIWKSVADDGTYAWHDHRIHWMSPRPPDSVKAAKRRTKIFDWRVPIAVNGRSGRIAGSLYWLPESTASPLASILVFAICAIVVLTCAGVWLRRTRDAEGEAW